MRLDTTPPRPRVTSIGPSHAFGPELAAQRRRRRRAPRRARAQARRPAVQDRARARRAWCSRTSSLQDGAKVWTWNGQTPSGRPVSPGTYLVSIETRDEAGNRGLSPPLNRRGLPATSYGAKLPGHGGITVRYLGVRPPNVATPRGRPGRVLRRRAAQAVDVVGAPRRVGRGDPQPPQDLGARAPARSGARVGRLPACRCARPRTPRSVPFAVQSAKRHRVLVVLPVMTWQGRNSLDDDGDGLPNLLDARRRGQALPRLRRRRAARRTSPRATRRCWRGWTAAATATTSPPTWRSPPTAARGWRTTAASSCTSDARWLPRALQQRLRRYVRGGGRVASFGVDSLRRQVSLTRPRADGRSHAARDDGRLRRAAAPAACACPSRPTSSTASDDIDFFGGTPGAFGPFSLVQEAELTAAEAEASAVTEDPQTGRPVIAAQREGKGLVLRFGVPELPVAPRRARQRPEHRRPPGSDMDAPVPLILAALLAAGALVAPGPRARAAAMLGALVLAPVILGFHIADSDQVKPLRDHPSLAVAGAVGAVVALAVLALLFDRRPSWLPVAAAATLPFRVPIASGGSTANLLVPLYLVVAAGALAYAVPRLAGPGAPRGRPRAGGARVGAGRQPGPLRHPVELLRRLRPRAGERRLLLRPLRAALRARGPRGVDAEAGARLPRRARRPRAGPRRGRLRRVRHAPPVPQPEGHRLQPARGLLPGQLAVLRPQHLRALPRDRDAAARRRGCCGRAASARSWPARCCSPCCGAGWC